MPSGSVKVHVRVCTVSQQLSEVVVKLDWHFIASTPLPN
jgi:hypothetical protein